MSRSDVNKDEFKQVAEETPFDNDTNGFVSDDVQTAIEELNNTASPGFIFSREVESGEHTFLKIAGGVKSNIVGIPINGNLSAKKIIVGNLHPTSNFTVNVWMHDGDMTNSTLAGSVNKTNTLPIESFIIDWPLTMGKFMAIEIVNIITIDPEETAVFVIAKGTV